MVSGSVLISFFLHIRSDQIRSVIQSCPTLCDPMNWSTPGLPVHHQLPESTQTHVHWVGDAFLHLILYRPLLLLTSIFPSIRVLLNESALRIRWSKYWSFSFNISPSNEHPGLISFRMDCLDLLAVQGTLKSLLQHYSSKASILQCSAFFIVQLSHSSDKAMAPHSSVLAWRIPGTGEPGRLLSMGSHRVGHDWSDLAAAAILT